MIWSKKQTIDRLMSILTDVSYRIVKVSGKIGARVSDWFMNWLIIAIGQLNEPIEESLGQFERSNKLDSNYWVFLVVEKVWMGGQVQQVVTGQGGRMCTFCTDLTKRDTDTRLEHQERHRHTAPTQRGTETHDSNTKRDTDTHLKHKRDTDTRLEHKERQQRHRKRTQS